jgi:hypothetical protein
VDGGVQEDVDMGGLAFGFQHVGDIAGGAVAEKLAESFFVVRNGMAFDEGDEIRGGVARQRRFGEMGIGGDKIFRAAMKISEIAAASAGDEDFLADARGALEYRDAAAALAGFNGAQQAGGSGTENQGIVVVVHFAKVSSGGAIVPRAHRSRVN